MHIFPFNMERDFAKMFKKTVGSGCHCNLHFFISLLAFQRFLSY